MQAYYEIETQIPQNHRLKLQLPETIPVGLAKSPSFMNYRKQQKIKS